MRPTQIYKQSYWKESSSCHHLYVFAFMANLTH